MGHIKSREWPHEKTAAREVWIDYIKVFACILVVLGHFFQSMVKASILSDNSLYQWFNTTIYYFHVPLFFICSGYLYQRCGQIDSFPAWGRNVLKKAVALGIPYFVFSFATWLLKTLFSDEINNQIGGLGDVLFIHPTSPYWFLYILFLIFVITPTVKTKKGIGIMSVLAVSGKFLQIIGGGEYIVITDLRGINIPVKLDLVCAGYNDCIRRFTEAILQNNRCVSWRGVPICRPLVIQN